MFEPDKDQYGEVVTSGNTYKAIASELVLNGSVVIGWTDGRGSHFDILFAMNVTQHGVLSGGQTGSNSLFVSILRLGAFGFAINSDYKDVSYIAEKLSLNSSSSTTVILTDLINGVINLLV